MTTLVALLLIASIFYCFLVIIAAAKTWTNSELSNSWIAAAVPPGISVLKPLSGADEGLDENLRSFFEQDYPNFELVFAVRDGSDPAAAVVRSLIEKYPEVPCQFLITDKAPYANGKVFSLSLMMEAASHDLLVMSDSDIRVHPKFLAGVADEFSSGKYDLATCPYRAVPGGTLWSRLEALGMNTEFWGGVVVAKLVEGMRFAVGPTIVARRSIFDAISWESLSGYLAEDFVLGQQAAELGFRVALSQCIVEHRLGGDTLAKNFLHRVRWARSTRRSRPAGYIGQLFTHPLPFALALAALHPTCWPIAIATLFIRSAAAYTVSTRILSCPLSAIDYLLLPFQDLLGFAFWLVGFSGSSVHWRGHRYRLNRDGTFEPVH